MHDVVKLASYSFAAAVFKPAAPSLLVRSIAADDQTTDDAMINRKSPLGPMTGDSQYDIITNLCPIQMPMATDRYLRQTLFAPLGRQGQEQLSRSKVLICGCGALGSVVANTLARAGVGYLRIVDRDFLELNNLQRQVLYTEDDVEQRLPKSIAAANRLRQINSAINVEPIVADVHDQNVDQWIEDIDVISDGTDNFETRFLLNDVAHRSQIPWVYGGCIGSEGHSMTVIPGLTPCLRCLVPDVPPPGSTPTCDTAGILGSIVNIVASIQATEILKLCSGNREAISRRLAVVDVWNNQMRHVGVGALKNANCPTCGKADYEWLRGQRTSRVAILCGRNAVQVSPASPCDLDLETIAAQLQPLGDVHRNRFLVRAQLDQFQLTCFPDGRAVVEGTDDPATAKKIYARYLGI